MTAPTEADGWRVLQDPVYPNHYWRCRAFILETNFWWLDHWYSATWHPLGTTHWANAIDTPGSEHRKQLWLQLFLAP